MVKRRLEPWDERQSDSDADDDESWGAGSTDSGEDTSWANGSDDFDSGSDGRRSDEPEDEWESDDQSAEDQEAAGKALVEQKTCIGTTAIRRMIIHFILTNQVHHA